MQQRTKQGLDYFPLNTHLMHDRILRRVMKREGDISFTILLYTLSYIYSGKGYYVLADNNFFDELSDLLYSTDNEQVCRVIQLLVEFGFFDSALYERHHVLTSVDIQQQYFFITKRRRRSACPEYCLLPEMQEEATDAAVKTVAATPESAAEIPVSAAETPVDAAKNKVIKRKEKETKENILPNPPSKQGGDKEEEGISCNKRPVGKKRVLTQEDIDRLQAPCDGRPRNLSGLIDSLRLYHIPPAEQYAIVLKSDYGAIGGNVWKGLSAVRASAGKIKLPGHYLLSVMNG